MFQKLLKKIARELKKTSIPCMVIGGQAILLYGEPRLTRDIDITLGINVDELDKVLGITSTLRLKVLVENEQELDRKPFYIIF